MECYCVLQEGEINNIVVKVRVSCDVFEMDRSGERTIIESIQDAKKGDGLMENSISKFD